MAYLMLVAALLANSPDAAVTPPATGPAATIPVRNDKPAEKTVCRRVVPTGSIMAIRTCRSQKEWDALSAGGQDMLRQTKDHQSTMGGIPLP